MRNLLTIALMATLLLSCQTEDTSTIASNENTASLFIQIPDSALDERYF